MLNLSIPTAVGRALVTPDGYLHVTATPDELATWAALPRRWPCAVLPSCTGDVAAEFAPNGDLLDVTHPGTDDVPAHELAAWVAAVLMYANVSHPARDR